MEKNKYENLLDSISMAFDNHSYEMRWFLSLTAQDTTFLPTSAFDIDVDCLPQDGEELIPIDPMPSREGYCIMESFIETMQDAKIRERLQFSLEKRRPFFSFKEEVYKQGVSDEWYAYYNKRMQERAEEWMEDNDLEYTPEGKIVYHGKNAIVFNRKEYLEEEE